MDGVAPADEVRRLQRCMSDLISVLALPAVWSGQAPQQIVTSFHDALMAMLDLDFLFTCARTGDGNEPIEVWTATSQDADLLRQGGRYADLWRRQMGVPAATDGAGAAQ